MLFFNNFHNTNCRLQGMQAYKYPYVTCGDEILLNPLDPYTHEWKKSSVIESSIRYPQ